MEIVLLGDGGVGKSCFLQKLETGKFEEKYIPTWGYEKIIINDIEFYDTSGQERYGEFKYSKFKNFLVCCDDSKISQKNAKNFWTNKIRKNVENPNIAYINLHCNEYSLSSSKI